MGVVQRVTGLSAVAAGTAWVAACVVHNLQPQGCIGAACAAGPSMRAATPFGIALFALAGVLLATAVGGLLLMARRRRGASRTAGAAALACAAGLVLLLAAGVVSTFVDPDWSGVPALVGPGLLLLTAGLVLVALVLWQARVVPHLLLVIVLLSVLLVPLANEQTSRVLLAIPFGLALAAVGIYLLAGLRLSPARASA